MKKFLSIFGAVAMLIALPAKAEFNYGVSVILGEVETSGSETEKTVSGVITFSWRPIRAFNNLKGDPGEYSACRLLSKRGFEIVSFTNLLKDFDLFLPIRMLGL